MKLELTRRGSYAIRAAVSLARIDDGTLTSSARIAAAMGIPPRFLPQVMGDLVRAGIVEGVVGRSGGYRLGRPPEAISLLEGELLDGIGPKKPADVAVSPAANTAANDKSVDRSLPAHLPR